MDSNPTASLYLNLNSASRQIIESATSDPKNLGHAQQRIDELQAWLEVLAPRPESVVLKNAANEASVGLFLLASGLYRSAFHSLRLFLELSLASVYFSANRVELAEWINGVRDVKWSILADEESGILSRRYAEAFFPELRDSVTQFRSQAGKDYRELSEFVHGNHHTWGVLSEVLTFNPDAHARWLRIFESASAVSVYTLALRFLREFRKSEVARISGAVLDCVGHVAPIRDFMTQKEQR